MPICILAIGSIIPWLVVMGENRISTEGFKE